MKNSNVTPYKLMVEQLQQLRAASEATKDTETVYRLSIAMATVYGCLK